MSLGYYVLVGLVGVIMIKSVCFHRSSFLGYFKFFNALEFQTKVVFRLIIFLNQARIVDLIAFLNYLLK